MNTLRACAAQLNTMEVYDPKYLPAKALLSANENPHDISKALRSEIAAQIALTPFNRYPDPLAHDLRKSIAAANGLDAKQVLVGNGGDELLFNLMLAWGGPGRKLLNVPPTFSVYAHNAALTKTEIVDVWRKPDFKIDEERVLERVAQGDIDIVIITSPNNPTGDCAEERFIEKLLQTSDTLVLVDEAYGEFCSSSVLPLIKEHKNLAVLHTFSKAYSLAAIRLGYVFAHAEVIEALIKVRQPYSVNAVSQAIGRCVFEHREKFVQEIALINEQRDTLYSELSTMENVKVYQSAANFLLIKVENAHTIWEKLYERGVLVRDFSTTPGLANCLRVSIGTPNENALFLNELKALLENREAR